MNTQTSLARGTAAARCALEDELMTLWGHINAATFRFLELLAEFDRNEVWNGGGITSCAHWLNVYCGIGTVAAREKVRVARALESLPQISDAFRLGEISYSKVRAMTRIATPAIEESLLNVARHGTASQMAKLVKHFRAVERRAEAEQAAEIHRERCLRTYHDDDGTLVLVARLPAEIGAIIERAIDVAMALEAQVRDTAEARTEPAPHHGAGDVGDTAEAPADRRPHGDSGDTAVALTYPKPRADAGDTAEAPAAQPISGDTAEAEPYDPIGARRADALTSIAERFLADEAQRHPSSSDRYQVVVHIDQALLSGTHDPGDPLQICELDDGPRLALETARRLACDSCLVGIVESRDGHPLDVGRKTRAIPPALKRALDARDGGCRFPGCTRRHDTHAHHIEHWADGGETALANLVTLCPHHHRVLHEGGFGVEVDAEGELVFTRPDGTPLLGAARPRRFRGSSSTTSLAAADREIADLIAINTGLGLDIDASTARTHWTGERLDYSIAIEGMYLAKHGRL